MEILNDDCDEWGYEPLVEGIVFDNGDYLKLVLAPDAKAADATKAAAAKPAAKAPDANAEAAAALVTAEIARNVFKELNKIQDFQTLKTFIEKKKLLLMELFMKYIDVQKNSTSLQQEPDENTLDVDQIIVLFNTLKLSNKRIFDFLEMMYLHCKPDSP